MPMPNRNTEGNYRYAFQGQEKDPETGMEAFELRLWDARIGRWLTTDPAKQYASPYLGMGNNPISRVDPDGGMDGNTSCCPGDCCPNGETGFFTNFFKNLLSFGGFFSSEEEIIANQQTKEMVTNSKPSKSVKELKQSLSNIKKDVSQTLYDITPDAYELNVNVDLPLPSRLTTNNGLPVNSVGISFGFFDEVRYKGNSGWGSSLTPQFVTDKGYDISFNANVFYTRSSFNNHGDYLLLSDLLGAETNYGLSIPTQYRINLELNGISSEKHWGFGAGVGNPGKFGASIGRSYTPIIRY